MKVGLSVVVPAYNEERFIDLALTSINRHLWGVEYEVIVVDNGSTDRTAQLAAKHEKVKVISIPKATISTARNAGAANAHGVLLAFLDADVEITAEWAEAVRHRLDDADLRSSYLGGYRLGVPDRSSVIERSWFATLAMAKPTYLGGANIVVAPPTFHALKGFDERLITGEDVDFCRRAGHINVSIDFCPDLRAIHLGFPTTITGFIRREIWHGIGDVQNLANFIRSRTAIAAVLFLSFAIAGSILLAVGYRTLGLGLILAHAFMPLLFVLYQFRLRNTRYLPVQYLLGYTYLSARAYSAFRMLF